MVGVVCGVSVSVCVPLDSNSKVGILCRMRVNGLVRDVQLIYGFLLLFISWHLIVVDTTRRLHPNHLHFRVDCVAMANEHWAMPVAVFGETYMVYLNLVVVSKSNAG